jgi:hypothetical protein
MTDDVKGMKFFLENTSYPDLGEEHENKK